MQISARNLLKGTISNVTEGAVNGIVTISLDGVDVKANITMEAIEQLGLAEGKEAFAIVKASNGQALLGCLLFHLLMHKPQPNIHFFRP